MKTHGICNAQSARKHRRQGHVVTRFEDGRYRWEAPERLLAQCGRYVPQTMGRGLRGMKPTAVIVDEINTPVAREDMLRLSGRMKEIPMIADTKILTDGFDTPPCVPLARLVKHAEWIGERGTHHRISVGESYWPKRRNQHSKPYRILRIMSSGSAQILYDRGDDTGRAETSLVLFRELIGKRCD